MKDIILKAQELYFSYDDENTHSLNGLSLEIQRGKKVAFRERTAQENPHSFCAAMVSTALAAVPFL